MAWLHQGYLKIFNARELVVHPGYSRVRMIFEGGGGGNKNQRQQAEFFPLLTLLPKKSFVLRQCPGLTGF